MVGETAAAGCRPRRTRGSPGRRGGAAGEAGGDGEGSGAGWKVRPTRRADSEVATAPRLHPQPRIQQVQGPAPPGLAHWVL